MSVERLQEQTYLPEPTEQVAQVLSFLEAHEDVHGTRPEARYMLVGADESDNVEVPEAVHRVLKQIVGALMANKAVTVAPHNKTLTTQQAADLLGVSRPTVVKLINAGALPAETPGVRRRLLRLADVLAYRESRRDQQYRALMETSVSYDEDDEDEQTRYERMRRARAAVAAAKSESE